MTRIHASAVVDSKAEIANDVEIGPYSVIGPNVKIGAGSKVGSHTVIEGYTTIGKENNFGEGGHGCLILGWTVDYVGNRHVAKHRLCCALHFWRNAPWRWTSLIL